MTQAESIRSLSISLSISSRTYPESTENKTIYSHRVVGLELLMVGLLPSGGFPLRIVPAERIVSLRHGEMACLEELDPALPEVQHVYRLPLYKPTKFPFLLSYLS
jgi:hypothetical protein